MTPIFIRGAYMYVIMILQQFQDRYILSYTLPHWQRMTVQLECHYIENLISSSSSYSITVVLLTSVTGHGFGSAVTLTGLLTIMALSGWVDFSVNRSSKVGACLGWGATTLVVVVEYDLWACLAALFQVVPLWVYSACHSANGSTTCLASSAVSLV